MPPYDSHQWLVRVSLKVDRAWSACCACVSWRRNCVGATRHTSSRLGPRTELGRNSQEGQWPRCWPACQQVLVTAQPMLPSPMSAACPDRLLHGPGLTMHALDFWQGKPGSKSQQPECCRATPMTLVLLEHYTANVVCGLKRTRMPLVLLSCLGFSGFKTLAQRNRALGERHTCSLFGAAGHIAAQDTAPTLPHNGFIRTRPSCSMRENPRRCRCTTRVRETAALAARTLGLRSHYT